MVADLPPDIDLQEHLEAGTALQGNYFYETTVNVDNRIKTVVEKFRDDLRVEMSDDGDMTLVVMHEADIHDLSQETGRDANPAYYNQLREEAAKQHMLRGKSELDAKTLSRQNLLSYAKTWDSIQGARGSLHRQIHNTLESPNRSSAATSAYMLGASKATYKDSIRGDEKHDFGYVNFDHRADIELSKGIYSQMTDNLETMEIKGFSLEEDSERILNHEVGHLLSLRYTDLAHGHQEKESMADIMSIAYDAVDGEISQEKIDHLILKRSYGYYAGQGDHYSTEGILSFLDTVDLSELEGLDKKEATQAILEKQGEFFNTHTIEDHAQVSPFDGESLGNRDITYITAEGGELSGEAMTKQFKYIQSIVHDFEPDFPSEAMSPKQISQLMENNDFVEHLESEGLRTDVLQHIADRAYLITTEEDIALGLDKLEYEKPNTLGVNEQVQEQIPEEVINTYPFDLASEEVQKATDEELAMATYHNNIVQDVWRDVETLEEHNLTTDERTHKLNQHVRATQQEGYTPPVGLSAENVEVIHQQHEDSIAYHVSLDISRQQTPEHGHFKEKEQDGLAL